MFLTIVCIVLCIIFTIGILVPQYKNPLSQIVSYPPSIQKRVESLPQYQDVIKTAKRKNVGRKIVAAVIFIPIILAVISYFSGAKTFLSTFLTSYLVFTVVNLYDLIVLDIINFCHSKKLMIKGTEDMLKEYKNPKHHIRGFFIGCGIGLVISVLSGGIIVFYNVIK